MSSSFLICFPDIPVQALSITYDPSMPAFTDERPYEITQFGELYPPPKLKSAGTTFGIIYDLGTGNARIIDHLIFGGMDQIRNLSPAPVLGRFSLYGTNTLNILPADHLLGTASGMNTRTYFGRNQETLLFTTDFNTENPAYDPITTAFRYFFLLMEINSTTILPSKIYFGQAFDMGKEPDFYEVEVTTEKDADTWVYPRGHTIMSKAFYPRHRVIVEWDGVSDFKASQFMNKIMTDPYQTTVYLYTKTHLDPLFDNRAMYCRIVSDETYVEKSNEAPNWNKVYAVFEEVT